MLELNIRINHMFKQMSRLTAYDKPLCLEVEADEILDTGGKAFSV